MTYTIDGRYIQDNYPGIGRYTYHLIDALARVAPKEKFFAWHNPAMKNTRYDFTALARHSNLELKRTSIPVRSLREQINFPTAENQLLHSPYYIKPYFLPAPSVVTIFDLIPLRVPRGAALAARIFFRFALALAVRTSTFVIVPSRSARDDVLAALRVNRDKLAVIPLAADARFKPPADPQPVRAKYALPGKYVLYVGINKPHKNLPVLIAAWERAGVDAALVIAGAWDQRYASEISHPSSRVRWLPHVDEMDLPALYAGACVFVLPSLYEGFGLTLLEAMSCGASCIASRTSSLPEVGGDAPLYFNPRSVDGLAELIARVVNDRGLQEELRGKALARAKEFSWRETAQQTLDVYKRVEAIHQSLQPN